MKIENFKTKVIGPVLLLIPIACMHLGDGHHDGDHHSSIHQPSAQSLVHDQQSSGSGGQAGIAIRQDSGGEK
jgi:hypothetical protein